MEEAKNGKTQVFGNTWYLGLSGVMLKKQENHNSKKNINVKEMLNN